MKNKSEIVAEIRSAISEFAYRSKIMGKRALEARLKYEAAGPGDDHFLLWMRFRAEAYNWGHAARICRKALA